MRNLAAILLAGGVGSRLNILVRHRAKPAVPFGGIYRIIDFTLSNIGNSSMTSVAVLTQYKPLSLMDHIGDGSSWDMSGRSRSVKIFPPKTGEADWDWYRGTADAVRQNIAFVNSATSDEIMILSGDHVYHMDYRDMVSFHRKKGARVTIATIPVAWEETHQFGTAVIDDSSRIVEWEEKSPRAKSNLASMGIYVFDRKYLIALLTESKEDDFGHHIIPRALEEKVVYAYPFDGYWRDVGTIQAYWDANMDILDSSSGINPGSWRIMTNINAGGPLYDRPPVSVAGRAHIKRSIVSPGCTIEGRVENSVLSPGVVVKAGASVRNSIIMHDCIIGEGAQLERTIVDKEVLVGTRAMIGIGDPGIANAEHPKHLYSGLTVIGKRTVIPDGISIGTNCIIDPMLHAPVFPTEVKSGTSVTCSKP
ncbi:MAG TPA: sugar phosphate nucleotidyltransferase [Syntrophorhabdaceae bacterium]|nr:sugar phosphate nucleotidyltransferase [Syntrophorhabdaceae bacterium]